MTNILKTTTNQQLISTILDKYLELSKFFQHFLLKRGRKRLHSSVNLQETAWSRNSNLKKFHIMNY